MFTGIIQSTGAITWLERSPALTHVGIHLPGQMLEGVHLGASISVDGVCLTVVHQGENALFFDIVEETLKRTTLKDLKMNQTVNIERALKMGDELGGHVLSGHVMGTASVHKIESPSPEQRKIHFSCPADWMDFLFIKGFIAINGASLTLVDVDRSGLFSVHLIPETLKATNLSALKVNQLVNIEIDYQTQTIVQTVKNFLAQQK